MFDYTLERSKVELVGSMRKTTTVAERTVELLGAELEWLRARRDTFDDHSMDKLIDNVTDFHEIAGSTAELLKDLLNLPDLFEQDPANHDEEDEEEDW